jgi:glyoxylase-like metal-dependent hydrolase (beta-lactamase superfamily II)
MRERFGVREIEVVVATHIHDDHTSGIPYLQRHHAAACWALDEVAAIIEAPADWASTPCTYPKSIRVDRRLTDGEQIRWRGFDLTFHHAPGQTEFHSIISARIDGRTVAFTGDNYFLQELEIGGETERRPLQTTVFRNSFQLAMHRRCVEVMRTISPELVCPGHGEVIACSEEALDQYADFVALKEQAFRAAVGKPADHYIDLFWARLQPYLVSAAPGATLTYALLLRNNLERSATYAARLLPPPGWTTPIGVESMHLAAGDHGRLELSISAPPGPSEGRVLLTAEILIDGISQGPIAEALAVVGAQQGHARSKPLA